MNGWLYYVDHLYDQYDEQKEQEMWMCLSVKPANDTMKSCSISMAKNPEGTVLEHYFTLHLFMLSPPTIHIPDAP